MKKSKAVPSRQKGSWNCSRFCGSVAKRKCATFLRSFLYTRHAALDRAVDTDADDQLGAPPVVVRSYRVWQEKYGIGLRMAFGAGRGSIIKMVLRSASWQIGLGLGLGVPLAIFAGRWMKDQLFGVKPWDPIMLGAAIASLTLAGVLSSVVPVRRAAGFDPMVAFRNN